MFSPQDSRAPKVLRVWKRLPKSSPVPALRFGLRFFLKRLAEIAGQSGCVL